MRPSALVYRSWERFHHNPSTPEPPDRLCRPGRDSTRRPGWSTHADLFDRGDPGQLSRAERLQRAPAPLPMQDHRRRRPGRLGRVDHAVPRGELRRQGDHRGHGAEPDRQGPGAHRGALAAEQAAGLVVRLRRRHPLLRRRGDRHRALGPEGQGARRSVLDLLGGPVHERLPAIASCHAHYESIPRDGRGGTGVGLDRPAGSEDRLRQARQRPPRLTSTIATSST